MPTLFLRSRRPRRRCRSQASAPSILGPIFDLIFVVAGVVLRRELASGGHLLERQFKAEFVTFFRIAVLAGNDAVLFRAHAAASDRHEMIHGQELFREFLATVIASAVADLLAPPLALPQLFGLRAFALNVFGIGKSMKHFR